MKYELTMEQRDQLMGQLSEEQRHFIHHELVRGRRTLFARQLARKKCQFIPEDAAFEDIESFIEEWDYIGFTDSGEVSPHTKCECGRSLRYQHQVMHLPTNTMRYFGIDHLQLHTGIDAKAISSILKGFDVLDGEMNEMLYKYREGWELGQHVFLPLPAGLEMPQDIQDHMDAGLPLLDRQLARLRGRLRELDQASRQKRIEAALTTFNDAVEGQIDPRLDDSVEGHADLSLDDVEDGQGAFDFGESDSGQGAFTFGEPTAQDYSPIENAESSDDALFLEGAGRKTGTSHDADRGSISMNAPSKSSPFHLPSAAQRVVDDALKYGRISTRAVSEFAIEQKLVQEDRMSTGKPAIYIAIAAYLDRLSAIGRCELVSASAEDRVYVSNKVES
ncbi:hypothetical protein L1N85_14170 [Paenibacillus alkaliterrae]|uniref:hypothetical protein n=1 Tax=Paenibacillus alkaliterrae TaxID=320909 RepID=UPI001F3223D8|nr:hypothetical protein [Paenibacillus alkaliterrae]MCF2939566.1 hypothetical protein [Paenibacillus alkaliterrae]